MLIGFCFSCHFSLHSCSILPALFLVVSESSLFSALSHSFLTLPSLFSLIVLSLFALFPLFVRLSVLTVFSLSFLNQFAQSPWWGYGTLIADAIILLVGVYLCIRIRVANVRSDFNEGAQIAVRYAVFVSVFAQVYGVSMCTRCLNPCVYVRVLFCSMQCVPAALCVFCFCFSCL